MRHFVSSCWLLFSFSSICLAEITVTYRQLGFDVLATVNGTIPTESFLKIELSANQIYYDNAAGGVSESYPGYPTVHLGFQRGNIPLGIDVYNAEEFNTQTIYPNPITAFPNTIFYKGSYLTNITEYLLSTNLETKYFGIGFLMYPDNIGLQIRVPRGVTQVESQITFINKNLEDFFSPLFFDTSLKIVSKADPSYTLATLNIIPEPSALSLLAVGLGGLAIVRRRKS